MKTKICIGCQNEKPISEFYSHDGHKDGYQSICKECQKKRGSKKIGTNGPYKVSLDNFTDKQLVEELRNRGCIVSVKKKVVRYTEIDM